MLATQPYGLGGFLMQVCASTIRCATLANCVHTGNASTRTTHIHIRHARITFASTYCVWRVVAKS